MTPFRPSRERHEGADRFLELKMLLFVLGAAFGVAGMLTDRAWMIAVAVVLLGTGIALRVFG